MTFLLILCLLILMTVANYTLSNFEANYIKYLNNSSISRTIKKRLKLFFKDYLNYLRLIFPAENFGNYRKLFTATTLTPFKKIFLSRNRNQARWQYFENNLISFKDYLERNINIYQTTSESINSRDNILKDFLDYLIRKSFSQSTVKNYKADINQLLQFLEKYELQLNDLNNQNTLSSFSEYLTEKLSLTAFSVNRKLSALSSFLKWLYKSGNLELNKITHLPERKTKIVIVNKSPEYSDSPKIQISSLRIPNIFYSFLIIILTISLTIGIYHQFISNSKISQAAPAEEKRPSRILNFQGRLTGKDGLPIIDGVDVNFRIWNSITGGQELYSTGNCHIKPDQNGIFYTILGSTCGKEIPSTVFSENINSFLGITVSSDPEMTPRQQIASVGYALNTETLQGLSPQSPAGISTIPYINKDGHLIIAAESPQVKSTAGTFTIEGNTVSVKTLQNSGGDINLTPDGNGSINLVLNGFFPVNSSGLVNFTAQNIISGSLISAVGSALTAGYDLLTLSSGSPSAKKFSVDSAGNTIVAGNLIAGSHFQSSPSGTLINSNLTVNGLISDGGLGIFGSSGKKITNAIDFTKDTVIEFNFKTGSKKIEIQTNINEDNTKYYLFTWDTDKKMTIEKCAPSCSQLASDTLTWTNDSWHHGMITFSGTNLKWSIDKGGKTINGTTASEVPKLSTGYLLFSSGFSAVANLLIFPSTDLVLTSGHAWIGGRLAIEDNLSTLGSLGVGTTTPGEKLDVEGNVEIDASSTTYVEKLCHSGADDATNDLKLGDCAEDSADIAEYYGADPDVTAGDIVSVKKAGFEFISERSGKTSKAFVTKSTLPYQNNIIGIVSTNPYPDILSKGIFSPEENPVPIALAGRVPVKVSTENGIINLGDPITSGTIPGFGMKSRQAGQIVAKALQSFPDNRQLTSDNSIIPCPSNTAADIICGEIIAFVNVSWYEKPWTSEELDGLNLSPYKKENIIQNIISEAISAIKSSFETLTASSIQTTDLTSAVIEAGNIQTKNLSAGTISAQTASFSDLLTSKNLTAENLTADSATVSGTLYADNIQGKQIDELKSSFGTLLEKLNSITPTATPSPILSAETPVQADSSPSITPTPTFDPIPSLSASPSAAPSPTPTIPLLLPGEYSSSSASLDGLIATVNENTSSLQTLYEKIQNYLNSPSSSTLVNIEEPIKITTQTTLADTAISGQLLIDGSIILENNRISSLTDTLSLNSQNLIDFMGGQLIVDKGGNLTVKGHLLAEKGITTNEIRGKDNNLIINLSNQSESSNSSSRVGGFGELLVLGNTKVAGELSAWKLTLDSPPGSTDSSERKLTATENFLEFNINSPAQITNYSAGTSTIPAGFQDLVIYNNSLTANSLIYITPTSTTQNRTIYVDRKKMCEAPCKPYFTVSLDSTFDKDITFNWWIVN